MAFCVYLVNSLLTSFTPCITPAILFAPSAGSRLLPALPAVEIIGTSLNLDSLSLVSHDDDGDDDKNIPSLYSALLVGSHTL